MKNVPQDTLNLMMIVISVVQIAQLVLVLQILIVLLALKIPTFRKILIFGNKISRN
jgi:hypothetical protein